MNILLIGPSNNTIRSGQHLSPSLGLYRLKSYIEKKTPALVDVVDPSFDRSSIEIALSNKKYNIVGHSVLHPTLEDDMKIAWLVHRLQPDTVQIAGGQGAQGVAELLLVHTPISAVIRGFGERALESLVAESKIEDLPDTTYIDGHQLKQNNRSTPSTKEEFIAMNMNIDFRDIPYESYWERMEQHYTDSDRDMTRTNNQTRTIRIISANYCPLGCTFCSSTNFLQDIGSPKEKLRQLPAKQLIELMNKAREAHPSVESFYFNDDDFTIDRQRVEEFCTLLNNDIRLLCQGRVDDVEPELLNQMYSKGFRMILYGVETFSSSLAMAIGKSRKEDYGTIAYNTARATLNSGITPQLNIMLFLPQTKISDLEQTIDTSVDLMQQGARVTIFPYVEAYPGAKIVGQFPATQKEILVENKRLQIPDIIPPINTSVIQLSRTAIKNSDHYIRNHFQRKPPQPIEVLSLFSSVYQLLGKSTDAIDKCRLAIEQKYNRK